MASKTLVTTLRPVMRSKAFEKVMERLGEKTAHKACEQVVKGAALPTGHLFLLAGGGGVGGIGGCITAEKGALKNAAESLLSVQNLASTVTGVVISLVVSVGLEAARRYFFEVKSDEEHKDAVPIDVNIPITVAEWRQLSFDDQLAYFSNAFMQVLAPEPPEKIPLGYPCIESEESCVVCLSQQVQVLYLPCGHQCMCVSCDTQLFMLRFKNLAANSLGAFDLVTPGYLKNLARSGDLVLHCPIDRQPVKRRFKLQEEEEVFCDQEMGCCDIAGL